MHGLKNPLNRDLEAKTSPSSADKRLLPAESEIKKKVLELALRYRLSAFLKAK